MRTSFNNNISFQGNNRKVFDNSGNFLYKTTTYFFRDDFDWSRFIDILETKYPNEQDAIRFIVHSCSNGPEAYSCAMKLIIMLGEKAKKFFKITAKDINRENIECAQNGNPMAISTYDLYRLNYHTNNRLQEFMQFTTSKSTPNGMALIPKDNLRSQVNFEQGNVFEDIKNITGEKLVLLCRNAWLYFTNREKETLADDLAEKMDSTSLLGIGHFDEGVDTILKDRGFIRAGMKHLYTKPSR